MTNSNLAISARDVSKTFPSGGGLVEALNGVSVDVPGGGFVSLVGPSGSGKSTLLRMVAGLEHPTSGEISIGGESPSALVKQHELGMAFQNSALLPWRSVEKNIVFSRQMAGLAKDQALVDRLIDLVGLSGFERARPYELSGGMQQLNFELQRIWLEERTTTLMVTHSVSEAFLLSDSVVVMSRRPGRVLGVVEVPFGRPRDGKLLAQEEFFHVCRRVSNLLRGEVK